jgi:hypothetical protein
MPAAAILALCFRSLDSHQAGKSRYRRGLAMSAAPDDQKLLERIRYWEKRAKESKRTVRERIKVEGLYRSGRAFDMAWKQVKAEGLGGELRHLGTEHDRLGAERAESLQPMDITRCRKSSRSSRVRNSTIW